MKAAIYARKSTDDNDRDEAEYVVRQIVTAVKEGGRKGGDCAVLYRTNYQSRLFEEELLKYNMPYVVVGGIRFYDRAEVKDALAYLRLLINPADAASLRRIINKPARGIGKTTIERAETLASERGIGLLEAIALIADGAASVRVPPKLRTFLDRIDSLRIEVSGWSPADALAAFIDDSAKNLTDEDLDRLEQAIKRARKEGR